MKGTERTIKGRERERTMKGREREINSRYKLLRI